MPEPETVRSKAAPTHLAEDQRAQDRAGESATGDLSTV